MALLANQPPVSFRPIAVVRGAVSVTGRSRRPAPGWL